MAGKIRIISGRWRGRRIPVPIRPDLRPSGDRARETLFNWLAPKIAGARCLDLFAGTGILGLEAASRGAARVVLVEKDLALVRSLEEIRQNWPESDSLEIVHADALAWLARADGPFDIVFIDPPFAGRLREQALEALTRPGLLAPDARVYVESGLTDGGDRDEVCKQVWRILRDKRVGRVRIRLLARDAGRATI